MEVDMPLLTVNIAAKTFDEIGKLVGKGLYSGMDQFMEVAALNQLALERGVSPEELKEKGHRESPASSLAARVSGPAVRAASSRPPARAAGNGRETSRGPVAHRKPASSSVPESDIEAFKEHTSLEHSKGGGPAPVPTKSRPEGEHLWGQVNRVFAMKFAARWLAVMTSGERAWPRIEVTAPGITFDAAILGSFCDRPAAPRESRVV
jgi:hypothetical protein